MKIPADYMNPLPCKRCGGVGEVLPLAEWESWVGKDYFHSDPKTCEVVLAKAREAEANKI